jgi:hypothetical protein
MSQTLASLDKDDCIKNVDEVQEVLEEALLRDVKIGGRLRELLDAVGRDQVIRVPSDGSAPLHNY